MSRNFLHALIGHLLLAVAAFFMISQTAVLFPLHKISLEYKLAVTCATFCVYRLAYLGVKWPLRFRAFKEKKEKRVVFLLPLLFLPFLEFQEAIGLGLMALLSLAYFMEIGSWKGLRSIYILKSIWVALVWTIPTAVLPLFHVADKSVIFFFAERFLFMLALCIIYNLRDMTTDTALGISTIPHKIGVKRTRLLTILILAMNSVLIYFHQYPFSITIALNVSVLFTALIVLSAKEGGHHLYYSLAVDATMILQSVLVMVAALDRN